MKAMPKPRFTLAAMLVATAAIVLALTILCALVPVIVGWSRATGISWTVPLAVGVFIVFLVIAGTRQTLGVKLDRERDENQESPEARPRLNVPGAVADLKAEAASVREH